MLTTSPSKKWRPLYIQLAEDLRRQIIEHQLTPGAQLPSEERLAQQHEMSRTSVRQAIKLLQQWGLVQARQGSGTYVRLQRQRVVRSNERYQWEKDRVMLSEWERRSTGSTEHETGLGTEALDFCADYEVTEAGTDLASVFGVPVGTALLQRSYYTSPKREGVPLGLCTSHLIHDMIVGNPELLDPANEPWPGGTMHQLSTVGIELAEITDSIVARPPLPEEVEILRLEPAAAILCIRKVSTDIHKRVVEVADIVTPGDRTELRYRTPLKTTRRRPT